MHQIWSPNRLIHFILKEWTSSASELDSTVRQILYHFLIGAFACPLILVGQQINVTCTSTIEHLLEKRIGGRGCWLYIYTIFQTLLLFYYLYVQSLAQSKGFSLHKAFYTRAQSPSAFAAVMTQFSTFRLSLLFPSRNASRKKTIAGLDCKPRDPLLNPEEAYESRYANELLRMEEIPTHIPRNAVIVHLLLITLDLCLYLSSSYTVC